MNRNRKIKIIAMLSFLLFFLLIAILFQINFTRLVKTPLSEASECKSCSNYDDTGGIGLSDFAIFADYYSNCNFYNTLADCIGGDLNCDETTNLKDFTVFISQYKLGYCENILSTSTTAISSTPIPTLTPTPTPTPIPTPMPTVSLVASGPPSRADIQCDQHPGECCNVVKYDAPPEEQCFMASLSGDPPDWYEGDWQCTDLGDMGGAVSGYFFYKGDYRCVCSSETITIIRTRGEGGYCENECRGGEIICEN